MEPTTFVDACTYMRILSLVLGFILFISGLLVKLRSTKKHPLHRVTKENPRVINLYLKSQKTQKEHLFWMLVMFAIIVWYFGAILPSSYVSDLLVSKHGCPQTSIDQATLNSYNLWILLSVVMFVGSLIFNFFASVSHGSSNKTLHLLSYLLLILGTLCVIMLYLYIDICPASAECF